MKTKQLLTIAIAAAVLFVVGIRMSISRNGSSKGAKAGEKIVADLDISKVAKVTVQDSKETITVEFKDGVWRVAERNDYPAKYKTFITLLEDLRDLTVVQTVAADEDQYAQLKLNEPGKDDAGTLVTVADAEGNEIVALVFGKDHKSGGRFIRAKGSKDVLVVSKSFYQLGQKPGNWLDDTFFKIGDIQEATLSDGKEQLWKVSRKDKTGELELAGEVPEGKEVDTYKIGRIKNAFSYARFADVKPAGGKPEETGMDKPKTFVARQFDGMVYTVQIGTKDAEGKFPITVHAAYEGPTERVAEKDEKPEDKTKKDEEFAKQLAESQKTAAETNARTKDWVYLVDGWSVEGLTKPRDELLKDKPKPPEKKTDEAKGTGAK